MGMGGLSRQADKPAVKPALRVAAALLLLVVPQTVAAQDLIEAPDTDTARVRVGALYLKPTVALTNLGIDTNVFNEPESGNPQDDFTFTFTPAVEMYLRMGRTWLIGTIREDLVWFQEFEDQRSVNDRYGAAWLAPLTRVNFSVGGTFLDTRERPGYEIDTRAQRADTGLHAAAELRTYSKTLLGVRATRKTVAFADAQFYEDTNLEVALNRTETLIAGTFRHELTPLTSLTVDFARQNDRFESNPSRDADSTRIDGGVRFNRFALVTGSAQAGYRDFNPLSPDIPGYSGLVLSASLSYVALGSTKLGFGASRDIQYSYDDDTPYYLQTGIEATIAQQIYGPVDVEARVGSRRLAYEDRLVGEVDVENRVDQVRNYGGGIGYRTSQDLRIAFTAEKTHRRSEIDERQYDDLRYGVTITYGL